MRQAWLIMAHNEFEVLQRLVESLDSPESDFYLHFDKKVKALPEIRTRQGRLFVLKDRVDVRWGTVSQLQAELLLLETAKKNGPYAHYHILSGVHLPLKPLAELIRFYDSHPSEEILRLWPEDPGDADFKMRRYHFPIRNLKSSRPWLRALCQRSWTAVLKVQKVLGIRHMRDCTFRKADQWLSLTESACQYLADHKNAILAKYRWTFCPDEYFVASELMTTPGRFEIFNCRNLLFVEFYRESPKSFPLSRLPELQETEYWWARKFTSSHVS